MEKRSGPEPFPPLRILIAAVDEVAGVDHELSSGGVAAGLTDDPRPHREDVVLGIAEVNELESAGMGRGGVELEPLAPIGSVADAVGVAGARLEIGKLDRMAKARAQIGRMGRGAGGDRHGFQAQLRPVGGGRDLGEAERGIGARPPCHGHAVGRIGSGGEDDPIGEP